MASTIWKGRIEIGELEVPVEFLALVEDRKVHFRLLHREDNVPVQQKMVNPESGEVVEREEAERAVVVDEGLLVKIDDDELRELEPESSREIEVLRFVDPHAVGHQWYARPYLLAPDGDEESYAALVAALESTGTIGIARWVMRKKHYCGALTPHEGRLVMVSMRFSDHVVDAAELPRPAGNEPTKKELALARQLVAALGESFDHSAYEAVDRQRLRELVESKAPRRPRTAPADLTALLQKSIGPRGRKGRKGMRRAG
jgi:DNA end-binding protein Ku